MAEENNGANEGLEGMAQLWANMVSSAMAACQPWAGSTASPELIRQGRSASVKAWSDYWEQFLRSPAFLEAQQQCMAGSVESKRMVRECLGRLNHELELATSKDIDEVMVAMRRLERRLLEQFEQLNERLNRLSAQLDALGRPQ
jgi:hypothetical protein